MSTATPKKKKTPRDASEFEREQLRFFLMRDDITAALVEIDPSIAWLPWLAETKLLQQPSTQLAPWIEKNFVESRAGWGTGRCREHSLFRPTHSRLS
jgi:hypothetical protein